MGNSVTIGGDRLGAGKRMKAYMHGYERSNHDLGYTWKSTMAAGTLVPFMSELALPGDTFDIHLNVDVLTHPTIGPLFGSYKIQLDVFQVPIRLYQGKLHMNMLNIGMDMSKVPLPQLAMEATRPTENQPIDNQQINPSCIFKYLGISGLAGVNTTTPTSQVQREFNGIPFLAYWDIYKQYYANKQEEIGAVIHTPANQPPITITGALITDGTTDHPQTIDPTIPYTDDTIFLTNLWEMIITGAFESADEAQQIEILVKYGTEYVWEPVTDIWGTWTLNTTDGTITGVTPIFGEIIVAGVRSVAGTTGDAPIRITTFPLENIDTMRQEILSHFTDVPFVVDTDSIEPYNLPFDSFEDLDNVWHYSKLASQEGLGLKTYNSDLFNNWISTEWIDGVDGISAITAVSTAGDSFTIDELNMSKKIYDMLNRIAISDGTYDSWLETVYDQERIKSAENPMYIGGLIRNLVFQEVVSNAASEDQPLGTLAGRGRVGQKNKGGYVTAKISEPSYLMGIISLTPLIEYSQGNKWDTTLKTLNDLHKPALDEIGYQDLITDQMAWWDTTVDDNANPTYKSAGKQPAWINYMTNVSKVFGNFAELNQQMFMVLNRRYEPDYVSTVPTIKDLTTYIDPTKFNHIFADTSLDAQNFWVQIGVGMETRRKMSAKVIPNL